MRSHRRIMVRLTARTGTCVARAITAVRHAVGPHSCSAGRRPVPQPDLAGYSDDELMRLLYEVLIPPEERGMERFPSVAEIRCRVERRDQDRALSRRRVMHVLRVLIGVTAAAAVSVLVTMSSLRRTAHKPCGTPPRL